MNQFTSSRRRKKQIKEIRLVIALLAVVFGGGTALAADTEVDTNVDDSAVTTDVPVSPSVTPVPVKVIYVRENQPIQIVDSQGRLLQVIYLRKTK